MSKLIKLTQEKFAIVDNADFDWLNQWKWFARNGGSPTLWYAVRNGKWIKNQQKKNRSQPIIRMHRLILNCPEHLEIDHINGKGLDNRRSNLRVVDHTTNCFNQHKLRTNKTSKYQGVYWGKRIKKWVAQIGFSYKIRYLGSFETEEEAQKVYVRTREKILKNQELRRKNNAKQP